MSARSVFIFGHGYAGSFIADAFFKEGYDVFATTSEWHSDFRTYDFRDSSAHVSIAKAVKKCDAVIVTIPPVGGEDLVLNFLKAHNVTPKQIIYCSSTGVYADQNGHWATEKSELCFASPLSKVRYDIEQEWLTKYGAVILRLAGIYGPNRNVISRFLKAPITIPKGYETCFFNRIHVEDIAAIILKIVAQTIQCDVFNVADQVPAPMLKVLEFIFCEMRLMPDRYVTHVDFANLSPMMQYFYRSNKRISNQKLLDRIGYKFVYPGYQNGFKNIIAKKQYIL